MTQTIAECGEQALLQILQDYCPRDLIGDDGAVLSVDAPESLVVTTDVLVDNVHFSDQTTPADAVGWRAVAANLSDLAAMGANPVGITVGLGLPGNCSLDWVKALYGGMSRCLQTFGGKQCRGILGGDVCRAPVVTIAITALGQAFPEQILHRSGLAVGDRLVVTGNHGASRAGLAILQGGEAASPSQSAAAAQWVKAHQYPQPRLDVLPILRSLQQTSPMRRWGGMDSSDGLADAVVQLCRASGVGACLDRQALPLPPGFSECWGAEQAIAWCLYGGEDFELVLGIPPKAVAGFLEAVPQATAIGTVCAEPEVIVRDPTGIFPDIPLDLQSGFQHF